MILIVDWGGPFADVVLMKVLNALCILMAQRLVLHAQADLWIALMCVSIGLAGLAGGPAAERRIALTNLSMHLWARNAILRTALDVA